MNWEDRTVRLYVVRVDAVIETLVSRKFLNWQPITSIHFLWSIRHV